MKLDPKQYDEMVNRASPPSPVVRDCVWAFCVGGAICTLGEGLRQLFLIWYDKTLAGTLTSIALIFLAAIFTLPGWYQKLAAKAGAGTLVPITGRPFLPGLGCSISWPSTQGRARWYPSPGLPTRSSARRLSSRPRAG